MTCIADKSGLNTVHSKINALTVSPVNVSTAAQFSAAYANPNNKIINVTAPMTVALNPSSGSVISPSNFGISGNGNLTLVGAGANAGTSTGTQLLGLRNASNVYLEGIRFDGQDSTARLLTIGQAFPGDATAAPCNNIYVSNCEFTRSYQEVLSIRLSRDVEICYNHWFDYGLATDFVEAIYIGSSTATDDSFNLLIEGNHIENNLGSSNGSEAIDVKPGSAVSGPINILRNYIHDIRVASQGAITVGVITGTSANSQVNIAFNEIHDVTLSNNDGYGIWVQNITGDISANVVYNTVGDSLGIFQSSQPGGSLTVHNNTIDGNARINSNWGAAGSNASNNHPINEACNAITGNVQGSPISSWTTVGSGAFTNGSGGQYDPVVGGPLDASCSGGSPFDACGRAFTGEIGAMAVGTIVACCEWLPGAASRIQSAIESCEDAIPASELTVCGSLAGVSIVSDPGNIASISATALTISVPASGTHSITLDDGC